MRRALLLFGLGLSACIVQAPTSDGTQPTATRPPPAAPVQVPNGANFGDKLELTNVILAPGRLVAGDTLHVALNFKVLAPIDRDWSIFVHVEDVEGRIDRLNADHPPRRPTSQWKVGEVVRDDFEVAIPPGMPVKGVTLLLGLWDAAGDQQRLPVRNPGQVKNDGHDRVFVASIPVTQP